MRDVKRQYSYLVAISGRSAKAPRLITSIYLSPRLIAQTRFELIGIRSLLVR